MYLNRRHLLSLVTCFICSLFTDMDSFKEIFPFIKHTVLNCTSSDLRLYLQSLVDMGVISLQYYHSLLGENDIEDLCRKITLSLLENPDGCQTFFSPTHKEEETPTIFDELSILHSTESCLKLLLSETDPICPFQDSIMEDFEDIPPDFPDCKDLLTDDFVSEFPTLDISYIEELVNFTVGDENNLLNGLSEPEDNEEEPPKKRIRKNCPSRKSSRSQKTKQGRKKKGADTPAINEICTGNGTWDSLNSANVPYFYACSLEGAGNTCHPQSFPVVSPASFQFIASIVLCPEDHAPSTNTSIPPFPDRSGSYSPFVPSAADLPNSPEAASLCHCPSIEMDTENADKLKQTQVQPVHRDSEKHKLVNSFTEAQKQLYYETFASEMDFPYTEVGLVNSRITPKTGKVISKTAEKELVNYDLTQKETETLELLNLFEDKDGKEMETKITALLGQSGMGKTVLVKKICHEWSAGKFDQFSFVFYFECRNLDVCKQYSFRDFLFKESSCAQQKNIDVYQYILRNPEKVLLIFDGFDEFQDPEGLLHGSFSMTPSKTNKVKDLFTGLFQKKLLRGCTLLITARVREKLNQYLGKVDKIIEMMGFSPSQVEWYIKEYFKERLDFSNALEWIKNHQYVFSYCYIPFMCKLMCLFAEENLKTRNKELPLTLAALYYDLFQKSLHSPDSCERTSTKHCTVDSMCLDFVSDKKIQLEPQTEKLLIGNGNTMGCTSNNALVQNFSSALHTLDSITDRNLVRYISFDLKKRRNQESCPNMVRRFLIGLLYCNKGSPSSKCTKHVKKQKKINDYFQTLELSELCPQKMLEVFHCLYGANNLRLMRGLAVELNEELSFVNTRLTPPDVFVVKEVLKISKAKVSLDLRKTSIDQKGLEELVHLKGITSFRASLSDTVNLWKMLLADGQSLLLKKCIRKFTLEPFKVESIKDVTDLITLVDIQNDICNRSPDSSLDIKEIPALKNLTRVIFGLGKKHGQDGFLKLVEILPKLPALQHLDLNNLTENHIGDKGVEKLAEVFPELQSLQTLDLSQNNITGVGAKKLAAALPSLHSLQTLSLYNNNVCDLGAEQLANILPDLTSLEALHLDCNRITCTGAEQLAASLQKCPKLRSLRMYSMTIPHATLQRLQQRDSRISCLSIG
ncbi:MHC class II transactivator isoform X3 [Phyllobates terribilis]|uniref:MHC class II transactivator isoform X3 n=1 Tax=Phyllobates terribilis TaxID=111132 RepID=UPI003CCB68DE